MSEFYLYKEYIFFVNSLSYLCVCFLERGSANQHPQSDPQRRESSR
jgi:hypothetical protein